MADMDQGIKRLLQSHPGDVLQLALPGVRFIEPLPAEVASEPQLLMDTLYRVSYQGVECAVNVEAQAYPDPAMPRRCFEYGSRASIVYGLPTLSVVLWLERHGAVPRPPYEMRVGSWIQATWQFVNVELYQLSAREALATGHPGLLPLVPFMRDADLSAVEAAARLAREQTPDVAASELVSLLAVFGARRFGSDTLLAMIRRLFMSTELLEQSPLYREWVAKAQAEGEAKGEVEGEVRGLRESVQTVLESRFQTLDAELLAAIAAADIETLRGALRHVALDSLDDARERLRQRDQSV